MFSNAGRPRMAAFRVAKLGTVPMTHAFWKVPWLVELAPVLANTPVDTTPPWTCGNAVWVHSGRLRVTSALNRIVPCGVPTTADGLGITSWALALPVFTSGPAIM